MSTATNNSEFDYTRINEMSFEEIWQFGYDKILEQGEGCFTPVSPYEKAFSIKCLYRNQKGNKCLFGHMIPDDEYHVDFETESISFILAELEAPIMSDILNQFLNDLQAAHDNAVHNTFYSGYESQNPSKDFIEEFKANMKNVADSYNLKDYKR